MPFIDIPRRAGVSIVTVILAMAASKTASAAPALQIDPTWGNGTGVVQTYSDENNPKALDESFDIVVQPDGKVVELGVHTATGDAGTTYTIAAVRYNLDGTLDATFGNGGRVLISPSWPGYYESPESAVVLSNGKILMASRSSHASAGYNSSLWLLRLNADGSLDTSFGSNGRLSEGDTDDGSLFIQPDGSSFICHGSCTLQPDGKMVVGHTYETGGGNVVDLQRYNQDHSPDPTYHVLLSPPRNQSYNLAGMQTRDDGATVVGVFGDQTPTLPESYNYCVMYQVNPDGTVSDAFAGVNAPDACIFAVHPDHRIMMLPFGLGHSKAILFNEKGGEIAEWNGAPATLPGSTPDWYDHVAFGNGRIYLMTTSEPAFKTMVLLDPKGASPPNGGIDGGADSGGTDGGPADGSAGTDGGPSGGGDSGSGGEGSSNMDGGVADAAYARANLQNASNFSADTGAGGCNMAPAPASFASVASTLLAALSLFARRARRRR